MTVDEIFAGEYDRVEFVGEDVEDSARYLKTATAFANGKGGKLVFGVRDEDHQVVGYRTEELFQKMDTVADTIFNSCEPAIVASVGILEAEGKALIVAEIPEGMQRPYYVRSLGMSEGVFIRVFGETREAPRHIVQELEAQGTNRSYDLMGSDRTLTEAQIEAFGEKLNAYIRERNGLGVAKPVAEIDRAQLFLWRLIVRRGINYIATNAYLLLDGAMDKFPDAEILCTCYRGDSQDEVVEQQLVTGEVFRQIDEAYRFVLKHIRRSPYVDGSGGPADYTLPVSVVREMITNAVWHRSYLARGRIQVELYEDRLEVTSPGTPVGGITGLAKIRNRGLAEVFSYLGLIHAYGSGISDFYQGAQECGLMEPELMDLGDAFCVVLPRVAAPVPEKEEEPPVLEQIPAESGTDDTVETTENEKNTGSGTKVGTVSYHDAERIIALIRENPMITQRQIQEKTGIPLRTTKRIMSRMQSCGMIIRIGNNRTGEWRANDLS